MTITPTLAQQHTQTLTDLERQVVAGHLAMAQRNRLIVEMFDTGHRQSDIMRTINSVREEMGEKPVTLGAVHILIRRAKESVA